MYFNYFYLKSYISTRSAPKDIKNLLQLLNLASKVKSVSKSLSKFYNKNIELLTNVYYSSLDIKKLKSFPKFPIKGS